MSDPIRPSVERLVKDIGTAWARLSPPSEGKLVALWRLLCQGENVMHNLLMRLELAEQAQAEAVAHAEQLNAWIRAAVEAAEPFTTGGELNHHLTIGDCAVIDGMKWLLAERKRLMSHPPDQEREP
jgi:hypothetical protein